MYLWQNIFGDFAYHRLHCLELEDRAWVSKSKFKIGNQRAKAHRNGGSGHFHMDRHQGQQRTFFFQIFFGVDSRVTSVLILAQQQSTRHLIVAISTKYSEYQVPY